MAAELGLAGKPHPDPFLKAAELLEVNPSVAVVLEDATSGVAAGKAGGFGLVIGVNRHDDAQALMDAGADVVVDDLGVLVGGR
jgi:alpha,alpha-trehalase